MHDPIKANKSSRQFVGHRFNHVAVIQSFEENEVVTSEALISYLQAICEECGHEVGISSYRCKGRNDAQDALLTILHHARNNGHLPIIHFETHGDEFDGLIFSDNSEMSWASLAELLRPINVACGFNMLVVCTACYGFHSISEMDLLLPSPFYAVLGPSHQVSPGEIYSGIFAFYGTALRTRDLGGAYNRLQTITLTEGYWFCMSAEDWYERLVLGFARNHCTEKGLDALVRKKFREFRANGQHHGLGNIRRRLVARMRDVLEFEGFERFFAVGTIPTNRSRFFAVVQRTAEKLGKEKLSPQLKVNYTRQRSNIAKSDHFHRIHKGMISRTTDGTMHDTSARPLIPPSN